MKEKIKAVYEPLGNRLTMYKDNKVVYGYVGSVAHSKMLECATKRIDITFKNSDDMEKKKLIKQMHAMMAKKGLMHLKPDILGVFEVESTKDLTYEQLETVIMWLNETDSEYELRQKRSVVLYWLGRLGIKGSKQEGWDDVNRYLMQPRIAGKMLYEMSVKELDECTARLRMIHSKAEATSGRINRLKIMN
jgi:hypothetical protein